MGKKMKNAPIFLTLGQIRFNPVLQMADSIGAIQDRFRKNGYADFNREELKTLQFNSAEPTPQVEVHPSMRWRFGNSSKTSEYLLFIDRLVFQTTAYENSTKFIDSVVGGIQVVHDAVQLSYVDGVSVRTLDAVVPARDATLEHYLHPQLLGFYNRMPGALRQSALQAVSDYGEGGQLVARVIVLRGRLGMSLDLVPLALDIAPRFTAINGDHAILDNDCALQSRFDWDIELVKNGLRNAKAGVTDAFDSSVTEAARNEWR